MEYNFTTLATDNLEKLETRFTKLSKLILKEYYLALEVINNRKVNDHFDEIEIQLLDIFHDAVHQSLSVWSTALKQVEIILDNHL